MLKERKKERCYSSNRHRYKGEREWKRESDKKQSNWLDMRE